MRIEPIDLLQSMQYIAANWTAGHPAGRNEAFARHWLATPWVDAGVFTRGASVLGAFSGHELVGLSCAMVTPTAGWHMIWHVKQKGTGQGTALIKAMMAALHPKPMHVFGISAFGRVVYQKLGFELRDATRWRLDATRAFESHVSETPVSEDWLRYRYDEHPILLYQRRGDTIVRSDSSKWGRVLHVARLGCDWPDALHGVRGHRLIQAWSYYSPGEGWVVPSAALPTVFHPVQARGNTLLVAGSPALPAEIHGSDGGQDRPPCVERG